MAIPDRLAIVVGMDVDEARRDDAILGINLFRPAAIEAPDGGDARAADRHVALAPCGSGSVDDHAVADDEIEARAHRSSPVSSPLTSLSSIDRKSTRLNSSHLGI